MAETLSWIATGATIIAAVMTASNLGSRITGFGFAVFGIGALLWIAVGTMTHQPALLWTNVVLVVLDLFGVWRWLGRQAEVEEGARSATQASELTPGEALFPVSILTHAAISSPGGEVCHCIDAMAGCRSGRLAYVVVSHGGVAGVGETLRRLPWRDVHIEGEAVSTHLRSSAFAHLEELPRDRWPGR
jgi:membrane protein implicated in regulation of membrane protease activity